MDEDDLCECGCVCVAILGLISAGWEADSKTKKGIFRLNVIEYKDELVIWFILHIKTQNISMAFEMQQYN